MAPREDPVAALIPWYANGTLGADERQLVDEHLAGCEACRARLRDARALAREIRSASPAELLEHVDPRLLTDYVEHPATLDPDTTRWIERRLAACLTCREAHARLIEVSHALEEQSGEAAPALPTWPGLGRLWSTLASTVLRPVPALAYLVALALLVPALWLGRGEEHGAPIAATPTRIVTEGDRVAREGTPGALALAPLAIPASAAAVLLELETQLEPGDLEDTSFSLELLRGEALLWSAPSSRGDFSVRAGRVVVSMVLHPSRLAPEVEHVILLRASKPGDPLDGQVLFRRSFRISSERG